MVRRGEPMVMKLEMGEGGRDAAGRRGVVRVNRGAHGDLRELGMGLYIGSEARVSSLGFFFSLFA